MTSKPMKQPEWVVEFDKEFFINEQLNSPSRAIARDKKDDEAAQIVTKLMARNVMANVDDLKLFIAQLLESEREKYADALIWCSGSYDFQPEGKAREGWVKLCQPLIDEAKVKLTSEKEEWINIRGETVKG